MSGWDYTIEAEFRTFLVMHTRPTVLLCALLKKAGEDTAFGMKRAGGEIADLGLARRVSPLDLVALGIEGFEEVELYASGEGAAELLEAAAEIIEDGYEVLGYEAQATGYVRTMRRLTGEMDMEHNEATKLYWESMRAVVGEDEQRSEEEVD